MNSQPLYNPTFLNLEYFFSKIAEVILAIRNFFLTTDIFIFIKIILAVLAVFFVCIITYSLIKIFELLDLEDEELEHELLRHEQLSKQAEEIPVITRNLKWESARDKVFSDNQSDWKLAILEADVVLDDFLTERGYQGSGVGEKLKDAEQVGDFRGIQDAWTAHKKRNTIAHEGSENEVSKRDAVSTIALYEKVFEEEGYI